MIISLISHSNNQTVSEVIEECNEVILNSFVEIKMSFAGFLKKQLDHLQNAKIILIDLSIMTDEDEILLESLNNLRMLYEDIQIIIIATQRVKGEELLSEIFSLGIYNIITSDNALKKELTYCIKTGMSYKDAVIYKTDGIQPKKNEVEKIKERIIIKNKIVQTVNKAMIGFLGTQDRIGTTHTAIVSATYLKEQGYQVAILENKANKNPVFEQIREFHEVTNREDYFEIRGIDYYPLFDLQDISKVFIKNYNFILIDFGTYQRKKIIELSRCVMQVLVSGSKPWEIPSLNHVLLDGITEEMLKEYFYLFNFTSKENSTNLEEEMGGFSKLFFAEYVPDPFRYNTKEVKEIGKMFADYITEKEDNKSISFFRRLIKKQ